VSIVGAIESSLMALFPCRCAGCARLLMRRPPLGLCPACTEVLEPNLGSRCLRCDLPSGEPLCLDCAADPKAFDRLRAPFLYGGPIVELVHRMKFSAREDLAAAVGEALAKDLSARALAVGAQAITAVPLGHRRRFIRGYNQSAIIARQLAKSWELPYRVTLKRVRNTQAQSELGLAARRQNVRAAFVATGPVCGRILLVDDVVTSGETLSAAAYALRQAGASEVFALALARAPRPE